MKKLLIAIFLLFTVTASAQLKETIVRMDSVNDLFIQEYLPKQLVRVAVDSTIYALTHATLVGQSMQTVFDSGWYKVVGRSGFWTQSGGKLYPTTSKIVSMDSNDIINHNGAIPIPRGWVAVDTGTQHNMGPSIILVDDTLQVYYRQAPEHVVNNSAIARRYSYDYGKTWTVQDTILAISASIDYREPNIALLSNGNLILSYRYLNSPSGNNTTAVRISEDNGATWSAEYSIPGWASVSQDCRVIELANGNLLLPVFVGGVCSVVQSTDDGVTWAYLAEIKSGSGSTEANIVLLSDGTLMCLMRAESAPDAGNIIRSTSADDGATWSASSFAFVGWASPTMILLENDNIVVSSRSSQSVNSGKDVIRLSRDDGVTWSDEIVTGTNTLGAGNYGDFVSLTNNLIGYAFTLALTKYLAVTLTPPVTSNLYFRYLSEDSFYPQTTVNSYGINIPDGDISILYGDIRIDSGSVIVNDSLLVSGASVLEDTVTIGGDLYLTKGSQDYLITDQGVEIAIQGQSTGTGCFLNLFPFDGDGTDEVFLEIFGVGTLGSLVNIEKLTIGYSANEFLIFTGENGIGVGRDLVLFTEKADGSAFNINQIKLNTDGTNIMTSTVFDNVTSATMMDITEDTVNITGELTENLYNVISVPDAQNMLIGKAIHFDGINDVIAKTDDPVLDFGVYDFSIALRFKATDISGTEYILNKEAGGIGYGIYMTDDDVYIRFDDNTADASAIILTGLIVADTWYSLVITFDRSGNATAYLNGTSKGTVDISGSPLTLDNAGSLTIGSTTAGASFFGGDMSLVLFESRLLSASEALEVSQWDSEKPAIWFGDIGATQTEMITVQNNRDFSSGNIGNWVVSTDGNGTVTYDGTNPGAEKVGKTLVGGTAGTYTQPRLPSSNFTLVAGKKYRFQADVYIPSGNNNWGEISINPDAFTGSTIISSTSANLATEDAWQTITKEIQLASDITGQFYIFGASTSSGDIFYFDNNSVIEIGCVANYNGSGMATSTWYDNSSNGLDGAVSGAVLFNMPPHTVVDSLYAEGNVTVDGGLVINPSRPYVGQYWKYVDVSDGGASTTFGTTAPGKTYIYNAEVRRVDDSIMTGDSRDVMYKGVYRNYAANDGSSQVQGIGISVRNESGGTFTTVKAAEFGVNTKSGATTTNVTGVETTVEHYSAGATTNLYGIKVDLRNEGAEATNQYGIIITNTDNSTANASDASIYVTDAGTNTGWDYGMDMSGATIGIAEIRGQNGALIHNLDADTLELNEANVKISNNLFLGSTTSDVTMLKGTITSDQTYASGTTPFYFRTSLTATSGTHNNLRARVQSTASSASTSDIRGVYGQAVTNASKYGGSITGVFANAIAKATSTTVNVRGAFIEAETEGTPSAVTNLYGAYIRTKVHLNPSGDYVSLMIDHEKMSTGFIADAAIAIKSTTFGAAETSYQYGINMLGVSKFSEADVLFHNGGWIYNETTSLLTINEATIALEGNVTLDENLTWDNGADIQNDDADTLELTETVVKITGELILGDAVIKHIDMRNADLGKGANSPDNVTIGNNAGWSYDINDDSHMSFIVPHDWKVGTDFTIKILWAINEAYGTSSGEIKWQAQWSATAIGEAANAAGTTDNSGDVNIPGTIYFIAQTTVETIPGASMAAMDVIGLVISRIAIDGGTPNPTADPVILDIHIEYYADRIGE